MSSRDRTPPSFDKQLLVGAILSLGLGFAAFQSMRGGTDATSSNHGGRGASNILEFPQLEFEDSTVQRQRRDKYGKARSVLEREEARRQNEELLSVVRKANRKQFGNSAVEASSKELSQKISVAANRVVTKTGFDGFVAAGEKMFAKCRRGLDKLLEGIRRGTVSMQEAKEAPPSDQFERYRANCGRVLPTLRKRGIVDDEGAWASPAERHHKVFDILQRYRWASIISDRRPPLDQLTDAERRFFQRWRVETNAYPIRARRLFLKRMEESPSLVEGYDVLMARVRLEVEAGNLTRAAQELRSHLKKASDPPARYRRALESVEQLLRKAEASGSSDESSK